MLHARQRIVQGDAVLTEKDLRIIAVLREDGRAKLRSIAQRTGIPVSTAHERLQRLVKKQDVRMTSLPHYPSIHVPLQCWATLRAKDRDAAKERLREDPHVNTLLEVSNGADLVCEALFRSFKEQYDFTQRLSSLGKCSVHPVIEEIAKENAKIEKKKDAA